MLIHKKRSLIIPNEANYLRIPSCTIAAPENEQITPPRESFLNLDEIQKVHWNPQVGDRVYIEAKQEFGRIKKTIKDRFEVELNKETLLVAQKKCLFAPETEQLYAFRLELFGSTPFFGNRILHHSAMLDLRLTGTYEQVVHLGYPEDQLLCEIMANAYQKFYNFNKGCWEEIQYNNKR